MACLLGSLDQGRKFARFQPFCQFDPLQFANRRFGHIGAPQRDHIVETDANGFGDVLLDLFSQQHWIVVGLGAKEEGNLFPLAVGHPYGAGDGIGWFHTGQLLDDGFDLAVGIVGAVDDDALFGPSRQHQFTGDDHA